MSDNTVKVTQTTKVKKMVQIGMLSAVAVILMLFEIPLWFAPSFYKIDLSEVPVLIGAFAMGPLAAAVIEFIKILLNLLINGTTTACVGEFGNFLIGCSFVVPAGLVYKRAKTKKNAIIGMALGGICMTVLGCLLNAFVLLPAYAAAFGMPISAFVEMGNAINTFVINLPTFVIFAVGPFNLLKAVMVSVIVVLIYKRISPVLK